MPVWMIYADLPSRFLVGTSVPKRMQRLGDLAAGTMVVVDEPAWSVGRLSHDRAGGARVGAAVAEELSSRSEFSPGAVALCRTSSTPVGRAARGVAWYLAEPLRQKLDLPPGLHPDTLLCALYYMTFITDGVAAVDQDVVLAEAAPEPQPLPVFPPVETVDPTAVSIRT